MTIVRMNETLGVWANAGPRDVGCFPRVGPETQGAQSRDTERCNRKHTGFATISACTTSCAIPTIT